MTDDQLASMRAIGASLNHIGNAMAESFNHACSGSKAPLQPLDTALATETRNLRREGQDGLVTALQALRSDLGGNGNG